MAIVEHEPEVIAPVEDDPLEQIPEMDPDDALILGAIEVLEKEGWYGHGWGDKDVGYCILGAVNIAAGRKSPRGWRRIPASVMTRIYDAFVVDPMYPATRKETRAQAIMHMNDMRHGARALGGKKFVIQSLRRALRAKKGR